MCLKIRVLPSSKIKVADKIFWSYLSLYVTYHFFLAALKLFSLWMVFSDLIMMYFGAFSLHLSFFRVYRVCSISRFIILMKFETFLPCIFLCSTVHCVSGQIFIFFSSLCFFSNCFRCYNFKLTELFFCSV